MARTVLIDSLTAQRRVARALRVGADRVAVHRTDVDLSGEVFRCTGQCDGRPYFAKIYLTQSGSRRIPAFVSPERELPLLRRPELRFGGQADAELRVIRRVQALLPESHVPVVLGESLDDNTLVYEAVRGTRLDRLISWTGLSRARVNTAARAIALGGEWLRKLHAASAQTQEPVRPQQVVETIRQILLCKGLHSSPYARRALHVMEDALQGVPDEITVPVCLQHGDFTLPNLLWDARDHRLWVIDLEHSCDANFLQDLCSIIFDLRTRLLYPFTSAATILILEEAFWAGYGPVPPGVAAMVSAIANARIFYHRLPRMKTRRARRGWLAGMLASAYGRLMEPLATQRVLKLSSPPAAARAEVAASFD